MPAILITTDGTVTDIELPDGSTLKATCEAIGCSLVDVVQLGAGIDMWINDDGYYDPPINRTATLVAYEFDLTHQRYFGNVLLTGFTPSGDTVNLDPLTHASLHDLIARVSAPSDTA